MVTIAKRQHISIISTEIITLMKEITDFTLNAVLIQIETNTSSMIFMKDAKKTQKYNSHLKIMNCPKYHIALIANALLSMNETMFHYSEMTKIYSKVA